MWARVETTATTTLAARGLVKRYGERIALRGVSLSAGQGELVAVIGPNGAGKTTLLSILAGIQRPDEGTVDLRGQAQIGWVPQQPALYGKLTVAENLSLFARLERVPDPGATVERMLELSDLVDRAGDQVADEGTVNRAADEIGWVPQQAALYGKLTVRENLTLFARLERCADPRQAVERMLELTDLGERADDQISALSGGNRQRVNIAIGLLAEPEVLLLDEPSSGLDPRQRERLWEFILRLAGEGTTVIYATHHIQEADRYATQLIVLADGERVFGGSPDELEHATGTTGLDFEHAFVEFLRQQGH
jgi:ABC-2 type transport system ATP-binding protein